MKTITFMILFTVLGFAQEKTDSLKQVEIVNEYRTYEKAIASLDSTKIKYTGVLEYLSKQYQAIEDKKKKKQ